MKIIDFIEKNKIVGPVTTKDKSDVPHYISHWLRLEAQDGVVEGKLIDRNEATSKLLIFEPGYPGSASTQLENLWLYELLESGWTVFTVRHGGLILNGEFSSGYVNCVELEERAKKEGQKVVGRKERYTIADWLIEPQVVLQTLGQYFEEVVLMGHSFGSLAIVHSLLMLAERHSDILKKVRTMVSLSGTLGRVRGDDDLMLLQWKEHLERDWSKKRVQIGDAAENVKILHKAYDFIHDSISYFPSHIEFIGVVSWGKTKDSVDELISPSESLDFITSLGRGYLILDTLEHGDAKTGRLAHDMENLSPEFIVRLLNKSWRPSAQITSI